MKQHLLRDLNYFMGMVIGVAVAEWTPILLAIIWLSVFRFWQWRKTEPKAGPKEASDA